MSQPKDHISPLESAVVTTNMVLQEGNCEVLYLLDHLVPDQMCSIYAKSRDFFFSNKPVQQMQFWS